MRTSALILLCLFSSIGNALYAQTMLRTEYLCRPTDHSIEVQFEFDLNCEVSASYGTSVSALNSSTPWVSSTALFPTSIILSGLNSETRYYYKNQYRLNSASPILERPTYSFITARPAGSAFTFVVQADPHLDSQSDTAIYTRCVQNQLGDNPDFIIDLGDFLMTDKLKNAQNQIPHDTIIYRSNLLRSYYEKNSHSIPYFEVLGNHEGEAGWYLNGTAENFAVWDANERKKYFPNPEQNSFYRGDTTTTEFVGHRQSYYSWVWGDALFVVIDPYWFTEVKPDSTHGWRWTLGETQYLWLKQTLEQNDSKFKFIFGHQLVGGDAEGRGGIEFADLYEWGGNNLDGTAGFTANRPGWYAPIKDLLRENRVNIFFHGHDHFFGKQTKDCLIYQECPQPSHPNFANANQAADYGYFDGQILPNSGHMRISVSDSEVQVQYVRVYKPEDESGTRHNGDVSASYIIPLNSCYDSLAAEIPILYNIDYTDELAYPNPFASSTTIQFNNNQTQPVSINIKDENGKTVRHLLSCKALSTGNYQLTWDGTDDRSNPLENGVYIYTVESTTHHSTGRIIIQK